MREHLGQAATETMGRDLNTTADWTARFGRDPAVIGEHFAESCLQANPTRGGGSEGSQRCNSLPQGHVARGPTMKLGPFNRQIIRYAPIQMELAHGC